MKLSRYFFLLIIAIALFSCSTKKNYIVKVKLIKLTPATMYDKDVVGDYLFDAEEISEDSLKNKSKQLFLKGVDLYKNKIQPAAAIPFFKESILIYPDAKTYYELGNALMEPQTGKELVNSPEINEADSSFEMAIALHFTPLSQVFYNQACIQGLSYNADKDNSGRIISYLYKAFDAGFSDTVLLNKDMRINAVTKTTEYREMLREILSNKSKSVTWGMFHDYIQSFPMVKQPFEITPEKVSMSDYKQSISYDYKKFIPEMGNTAFGRNVGTDYMYVAKVAESPKYVAVVYASSTFYGGELQPVSTKLVSYDTAGNIISTRLFACQYSAEKIRTGKIDKNEITIQDYKRVWQHPIDSVRFEDNKVLRYEPLSKATFHLNDSGRIVRDNVPANFSDSAKVAIKP